MKKLLIIILLSEMLISCNPTRSHTTVVPVVPPYPVPGYIVLYGNHGDTAYLDTAVHWNSAVTLRYQSLPYVFAQVSNGLPPVSITVTSPSHQVVNGELYFSNYTTYDTCYVNLYSPSFPFLSNNYKSYQ